MGLLDDAIREHLELKRRHGADPSEVERQEQEALGPARRGAAPAADADPGESAASVGTLDEDEAPDALYDDELEYEDDELEDDELEDDELEDDVDEPATSVPVGEPEAPVAPPVREDRFDAPPREPRDEPEPEPRETREPADQATVDDRPVPTQRDRQDLEPPGAPDPDAEEGGSEDVLEETPEFLQETPEHDRLWFEQKPPRDFEF